ncbi:hypothetical protein TRFO_27537 [Tritrichomonas foetus]|uniref:Uncharacterized protein n=1 Tax=Tritrichomonas foetus TaxID=1144522 RepID=A0A1J4K0G5_9EUKA|nr:hypothetical protein TRFO_27537 [Tritrichomonas foetus]|eukprot:OHT04913.1 hypothetical protein TRFO_27537 [Tritrichomonas foetus]
MTINFLESSFNLQIKENQKMIVRTIFNIVRFRRDLVIILSKVCHNLTCHKPMINVILKQVIHSENSCPCHFNFIRQLIEEKYIRRREVVFELKKYYDENFYYNQKGSIMHFFPKFLWFLKEIYKYNEIFYHSYKEMLHTVPPGEFFLQQIKKLKKGNWKSFNQLTKHQFPENSIELALIHDDVQRLQEYIAFNDIDSACCLSLFDFYCKPVVHPILFQLASLYGSIHCVKYLIMNGVHIFTMSNKNDFEHLQNKLTAENPSLMKNFPEILKETKTGIEINNIKDENMNKEDNEEEEEEVEIIKEIKVSDDSDDVIELIPQKNQKGINSESKDIIIADNKSESEEEEEEGNEFKKYVKETLQYKGTLTYINKICPSFKNIIRKNLKYSRLGKITQKKQRIKRCEVINNSDEEENEYYHFPQETKGNNDENRGITYESDTDIMGKDSEKEENKSKKAESSSENEHSDINDMDVEECEKTGTAMQNDKNQIEEEEDIWEECEDNINKFISKQDLNTLKDHCDENITDYDYESSDEYLYIAPKKYQTEEEKNEDEELERIKKEGKVAYDPTRKRECIFDKIIKMDDTRMFAVAGGNTEEIRMLHELNMPFDDTSRIAIAFFHNSLFHWIMEFRSDFLKTRLSNKPRYLLYVAIVIGNIEIAQYIIMNYNININKNCCFDKIPLHLAIENKQIEIAEMILGLKSTNPNIEDAHRKPPIFKAIDANSIKMIKLIRQNPNFNPNHISYGTYKIIHYAASFGTNKIICFLLDNRDIFNIDINDNVIYTPIVCSVMAGNHITFNTLYRDSRIDVNTFSKKMFLHSLIEHNWLRELKLCLKNPKVDVNIYNREGYTPLNYAIENKKTGIINLLLENERIDTKKSTRDEGNTNIHLAAQINSSEIFQVIMKYNDISSVNALKQTPLHIAVINNSFEVVKYLLKIINADEYILNTIDSNGRSAFHYAILKGFLNIAELMIKNKKVDIHIPDPRSEPIFIQIVKNQMTSIIPSLLEREIDINCIDNDGRTPLHYAAKYYDSTLKILLEKKVIDPNWTDNEGKTPLFYAAQLKNTEQVQLLIEQDDVQTDIIDCTPLRKTALHYAAEGQSIVRLYANQHYRNFSNRIFKLILLKNLDVGSIHDAEGNTPFHLALKQPHFNSNIFIDFCCDLDSINDKGESYLHIAVKSRNVVIVHYLVYNCDNIVNIQNNDGDTALHYAVRIGDENVINALLESSIIDCFIENYHNKKPYDLLLPELKGKYKKHFLDIRKYVC